MDFAVDKREFLKLVSVVQSVVGKKSTIPVLACARLTAEPGRVRVAATDLYLSLSGAAQASVKKSGDVAVHCGDLVARLGAMPDGPVQVSVKDGALAMKSDKGARRFTLRTMGAEDYPSTPEPTGEEVALPSSTLRALLDGTHATMSTDEARPNMCGVLVEWRGRVVRAVSTDGHRLAKLEVEVDRPHEASMLLPHKAVKRLRDLFGEGDVGVSGSGACVFLRGQGLTFSARLVDAQFPPYEQAIPAPRDRGATVSRAALVDALKVVPLASKDEAGGVVLTFGNGLVRIAAESPEGGEGVDELPCGYQGQPARVGVSAKYLLDVVEAAGGSDVRVEFGGELDPLLVRALGARSFVGVVMPMRV